jgi:hypothetical protein
MSPDRSYVVECTKCQQKVVARGLLADTFPDEGFNIYRFIVATCGICYQVMFLRQPETENVYSRDAEVLWPALERRLNIAIPEELRWENEEARKCFKAASYTATVVMVRRTLEGVCADQGITQKPLVRALKEMRDRGLIEGRLFEWVEGLRVVGNEGAHFTGNRVSREDASDALALSEAILDYLYVFTAQFEDFKKRRQEPPAQVDQSSADAAGERSVGS